jgi:hypothetical protein
MRLDLMQIVLCLCKTSSFQFVKCEIPLTLTVNSTPQIYINQHFISSNILLICHKWSNKCQHEECN